MAPLLYGFWAFLATWLAVRVGAPLKWRVATPFIVCMALPFMSYAALKFGEAGMDTWVHEVRFVRFFWPVEVI